MSRRVINERRANTIHPEWTAPKPTEPEKVVEETLHEKMVRITLENDRLHARVRDLEAQLHEARASKPALDPMTSLVIQQLGSLLTAAQRGNPAPPGYYSTIIEQPGTLGLSPYQTIGQAQAAELTSIEAGAQASSPLSPPPSRSAKSKPKE